MDILRGKIFKVWLKMETRSGGERVRIANECMHVQVDIVSVWEV